MSEYPFVSVIVPIRNEADFIERTILSILENDYPADKMEIIVVDGMSDDGTREIVAKLAEQDSRIKLIDNPEKIVPFAMNRGIRLSQGDLFIRIDGHAEIARDFIKNSIKCLAEHPEAWVVGGYIETVSRGFVGQAISAAMQSPVGVGGAKFRLGDYEGWVDTLAFGTHHKWIVDKIGYFDEELVRNQDDEFNLRIILAGGKIWLSKAIKSKYYARSSLKKLWRQYFQYGFWRIRVMQKHKRPATLRQIVPLLFVLSVILLALGGIVYRPIWWILGVELALYLSGLMIGALDVARKSGIKYALLSPLIFLILHFAYGLGSLWGIVRFVILKGKFMKKPEHMKLSR